MALTIQSSSLHWDGEARAFSANISDLRSPSGKGASDIKDILQPIPEAIGALGVRVRTGANYNPLCIDFIMDDWTTSNNYEPLAWTFQIAEHSMIKVKSLYGAHLIIHNK